MKGCLRGVKPLLKNNSPFPFKRGRGIQGNGVGIIIITGNSELAARNGVINQMQIEPGVFALEWASGLVIQ
jgi:hypothetical protein